MIDTSINKEMIGDDGIQEEMMESNEIQEETIGDDVRREETRETICNNSLIGQFRILICYKRSCSSPELRPQLCGS